MSKQLENYLPFQNRYKKEIILNYGRPYTNYTTYNLIDNEDNITVIYVDNKSCIDDDFDFGPGQLPENKVYYVEIHYTPSSNIPKLENIMINHHIDTLINKYGCKV